MLLNVTNLFTFGRVCAAERVLSLVVCVDIPVGVCYIVEVVDRRLGFALRPRPVSAVQRL